MDNPAPTTEVPTTRKTKSKKNRKRVAAVFGCTAAATIAGPTVAAHAASNWQVQVEAGVYRSNVQVCGYNQYGSWTCTAETDLVRGGDGTSSYYYHDFTNWWFHGYTKLWWNGHGKGSWNQCSITAGASAWTILYASGPNCVDG
jgi:hypothetical protein